jgi:hypothetical protein
VFGADLARDAVDLDHAVRRLLLVRGRHRTVHDSFAGTDTTPVVATSSTDTVCSLRPVTDLHRGGPPVRDSSSETTATLSVISGLSEDHG